jgi:hypothetical protein
MQDRFGTMKQGASTSAIVHNAIAADALLTSTIHSRIRRFFTFTAKIIVVIPRIHFRMHVTMIAEHCAATVAV